MELESGEVPKKHSEGEGSVLFHLKFIARWLRYVTFGVTNSPAGIYHLQLHRVCWILTGGANNQGLCPMFGLNPRKR